MTYHGIEFVVRAGLGRNEWAVTINFPDASEPLARSSVVKFTGTRDEAIATAQKRIETWLTRQQRKRVPIPIWSSRDIRGGDRVVSLRAVVSNIRGAGAAIATRSHLAPPHAGLFLCDKSATTFQSLRQTVATLRDSALPLLQSRSARHVIDAAQEPGDLSRHRTPCSAMGSRAVLKDAVWVVIIVVASLGCFQLAIQFWDLFPH